MADGYFEPIEVCPVCGRSGDYVCQNTWFSHRPSVFLCNLCQLYYVSPEPHPKEIARFYKDTYCLYGLEKTTSQLKRHFKNMFSKLRAQEQVRRISSFSPLKGKRLLEVGAATGEFLNYAGLEGASVVGIEPNGRLHLLAKKYGRNVLRVSFEEFQSTDSFDMILFSHVLEHMPNVGNVIEKAADMVSNRGQLYVEVPFAPRAGELEKDKLCRYLNTPHLRNFSGDSLARLFNGFGFEKVVIQRAVLGGSCLLARCFKSIDFDYEIIEGVGIRKLVSAIILTSVLFELGLGISVWHRPEKNEKWCGHGDVTWALFQKR